MNEYEAALLAALMVLVRAITEGTTDKQSLAAHFRSSAKMYTDLDRKGGAVFLEILAQAAEGGPAYTPKLPFEVIQGGKTES